MNLIHLPTLDGSVEASVARLESLGRVHQIDRLSQELDDIEDVFDEFIDLADRLRPDEFATAKRMRDEVRLTCRTVVSIIDRLVAS